MIRFSCESCGKKLKINDALAGRKGTCPDCGKRLIVPAVSPSIREGELNIEPARESRGEDAHVPDANKHRKQEDAPMLDELEEESADSTPRRLASQSHTRLRLLLGAFALTAAVFMIAGVAIGYVIAKSSLLGGGDIPFLGVSPARQGESWSHKDLVEYLNSQKIVLYAFPTTAGAGSGPKMWFVNKKDSSEFADDLMFFNPGLEAEAARGMAILGKLGKVKMKAAPNHDLGKKARQGRLWVTKADTAEIAKDAVGAMGEGDQAFSWGRFVFLGDPNLIDQVRRVLK